METVRYFPRKGQLRLYMEESIPAEGMPCRVTATGLADAEGAAFSLDKAVYGLTENDCTLYDASIEGVTYISASGTPVYTMPAEGSCTVSVRVVNTGSVSKNINLIFYAMENGAEANELARVPLTLPADTGILHSESLTAQAGQTIGVRLEESA